MNELLLVPMSISRAGHTIVVEVSTELFSVPEVYDLLFPQFAPFWVDGIRATVEIKQHWGTTQQHELFSMTFKFALQPIDYIPVTPARIQWLTEQVAEIHTQFKLALWREYRKNKGYPDDALTRTTFGQDT